MHAVMYVASVLLFLMGALTCSLAKSAIHEGVSALVFLIAVVLLGFGAVVEKLQVITKKLEQKNE